MRYRHETANCLTAAIGPAGLTPALLEATLAELAGALARLRDEAAKGSRPYLALPAAQQDLPRIREVAQRLRAFDDVLVLATGGSSLGGQSLHALADRSASPRLHFLDNLDAETLAALLGGLEPARTACLAISKSGSTVEILAQLLACLAHAREALGESEIGNHFVCVSEPGDNPLRNLAARFGLMVLDHDPALGGRYSVLSLVGLLPALIVGLDAEAVRAGAAEVLAATLAASNAAASEPARGAAIAVALARHSGIATSVIWPYSNRLAPFGLWYRQLWAESLGKGGAGTTPVMALGPVDQHSQLQLYLDGPADKMFTLITTDSGGRGALIDPGLAGENLAWLGGRRIGDVIAAASRATAETLAERGRPVRTIAIEAADEGALGALFMHFMLETVLAADLLGVDPFDQPAVEAGKVLARRYLTEAGARGRAPS